MQEQTGKAVRGRLAPSPTGALHLGNARSFLVAWLAARATGGEVVFRMEDLDHPKVKPGAAEEAITDLRWLGLDWDEGPDVGGAHAPYTQSERRDRYRAARDHLLDAGLIYACVCSRRDVEEAQSAPHDTADGLFYPGTCDGRFASFDAAVAHLPPGRLPAWRFRVKAHRAVVFNDGFHGPVEQDVKTAVGDFAIARDRDAAGYMLGVVVDDAAMSITDVVRGDDLLTTTARQLLLYEALGLSAPAFTHVPLVVAEDGHRLAKRHGDTRISALRERGVSAERIVGLLAYWCGWAEWGAELTAPELISRYDLSAIPKQAVVLDARVRHLLGM